MKLNLGSGNRRERISDGWINVDFSYPEIEEIQYPISCTEDVIEVYKEPKVCINDDVRTLDKFKDESADHIRAYHLIEHLEYDDALIFLRKCFTKLKEGGTLELEMPCLVKCSKKLLDIYDTLSDKDMRDGEIIRIVLRGFYGMYQQTDTHMNHLFGWTFKTLRKELSDIGFIDIEEEEPTIKIKERDFRVVCKKG